MLDPTAPVSLNKDVISVPTQPTLPQAPSALGVHALDTHPELQTESFKELTNKIAWAIGSTYGRPYNNTRTPARLAAVSAAKVVVAAHGYPRKISKDLN